MCRLVMFSSILVIFAGLLLACGGSGHNSSSPENTLPDANIAGNWQGNFSSDTGFNGSLFGPIEQSGSVMMPTSLGFSGAMCFMSGRVVSGSVKGTNINASLTTDEGSTLTLSGTTDGSASTLTGRYDLIGGACGGAQGRWSATRVATVSGTWAGTLTSFTGSKTSFSGDLVENTKLVKVLFDIEGHELSVNLTFQSETPCFASQPATSGGNITGTSVLVGSAFDGGQSVSLFGTMTLDGHTINGDYDIFGGLCDGESGNFTMSKN